MIIGERLKEARIAKNMTQQELGDALGVSKVSICGYEKGTRTPTMENFLDLIELLDLDVKYVLGQDVLAVNEEGEPYPSKMATNDFAMVNAIKTNRELYNLFCSNPQRTVEQIKRKMNL